MALALRFENITQILSAITPLLLIFPINVISNKS